MTPRIRSSDRDQSQHPRQGEPLSSGDRACASMWTRDDSVVNRCAWSAINATRPCVYLLRIGLRYRYRIIRRLKSIPVEKNSHDVSASLRQRVDAVRGGRGFPFTHSGMEIDLSTNLLRPSFYEIRWKRLVTNSDKLSKTRNITSIGFLHIV
ncbi:uncharacterized protein LOC143147150 [Ptiloglossa arizonensis]|uniref:uncharacterized protein LOC143147150 n=1 Tax=Ptiloglossa arizonensis TaxID=3350558 RepID=UPI003F9F91E2